MPVCTNCPLTTVPITAAHCSRPLLALAVRAYYRYACLLGSGVLCVGAAVPGLLGGAVLTDFVSPAFKGAGGQGGTIAEKSALCHCIHANTCSGNWSAVVASMMRARSSTIFFVLPRIIRHTGPATEEKATSSTTSSERSRLCHRSGIRTPRTAGRLGTAVRIASGAPIGFARILRRWFRNSGEASRNASHSRFACAGPLAFGGAPGAGLGRAKTWRSVRFGGPGS
mmetsp:Transcript_14905/g.37761  ORF Transcript_14905/g.37761 Transcript_14905/m.37761 type:complete len:226 (-) Transcript_14905:603-1280(-)